MSDTAADLLPAQPAVAAPAAPVVAPASPVAPAAVVTTTVVDPAAPVTAPVAAPADPDAPKFPGLNAKPEEWKEYFGKLGAPKDADGYKLTVPEGGDAVFAKEAAGWMAEAGLLPHQAEALTAKWNAKAAAATTAFVDKQKADDAAWIAQRAATNAIEKTALQTEWGPQNEANFTIAKQAVAQFFPADKAKDALLALEDAMGYGATMKLMHAIGKGLGEGSLRGAGSNQSTPAPTLAQRMYPNSK